MQRNNRLGSRRTVQGQTSKTSRIAHQIDMTSSWSIVLEDMLVEPSVVHLIKVSDNSIKVLRGDISRLDRVGERALSSCTGTLPSLAREVHTNLLRQICREHLGSFEGRVHQVKHSAIRIVGRGRISTRSTFGTLRLGLGPGGRLRLLGSVGRRVSRWS